MERQISTSVLDQTLASLVHIANQARDAAGKVLCDAQDLLFERAAIHIDNVRFALDHPENILGALPTKHGEIAEMAEVGIRSAWDTLNGMPMSATVEGVGRTAAADYILNGVDVQSKFHNGVNNTLRAVVGHMDTYPHFGEGEGVWVIPRDQYETVQRVLAGEPTGLKSQTEAAIRSYIESIQAATGREFADAVQPASFDYPEVQLGKIDATLDDRQAQLSAENENRKEAIAEQHEPSLMGGLQAAAGGAVIGAGISFTRICFTKYRQGGKNVFKGEFTSEDWKEAGIDTGEGALIGGVSAGALYYLTNCQGMAAPLAGAMVSAVKGLAPLVQSYAQGEINEVEFINLGMVVCSEVGLVASGALLGQAIIPIPVLGAFLGSVAAQVLSGIVSGKVKGAAEAIQNRLEQFQAQLTESERRQLAVLEAHFGTFEELTAAAFDTSINGDILLGSVMLARAYGLPDSSLLLSVPAVDAFMTA